jgi:hypothetical protein
VAVLWPCTIFTKDVSYLGALPWLTLFQSGYLYCIKNWCTLSFCFGIVIMHWFQPNIHALTMRNIPLFCTSCNYSNDSTIKGNLPHIFFSIYNKYTYQCDGLCVCLQIGVGTLFYSMSTLPVENQPRMLSMRGVFPNLAPKQKFEIIFTGVQLFLYFTIVIHVWDRCSLVV